MMIPFSNSSSSSSTFWSTFFLFLLWNTSISSTNNVLSGVCCFQSLSSYYYNTQISVRGFIYSSSSSSSERFGKETKIRTLKYGLTRSATTTMNNNNNNNNQNQNRNKYLITALFSTQQQQQQQRQQHSNVLCWSGNYLFCHDSTRNSRRNNNNRNVVLQLSDWSDFNDLDDDDDDDDLYGTSTSTSSKIQWANENDTPEEKAAVGSLLDGPEIISDQYYEPLYVPQGSIIELNEENVQRILMACRYDIQTMFGYTKQNRGVGITGGVDYIELDGPIVIIKLKGRFWHQRTTVLNRIKSYIMTRIPEIIDVVIDDPYELTDEANNLAD